MANSKQQLKAEDSFEEIRSGLFTNFELHFKRIEKLVDETVNKLIFAMTIPKLMDKDFECIKTFLDKSQRDMLERVFSKYSACETLWLSKKTSHYTKLSCLHSVKMIEDYFNSYSIRTENIPQRDEYDFSNVLQLLYSNENIKRISEQNRGSGVTEASSALETLFQQLIPYYIYKVILVGSNYGFSANLGHISEGAFNFIQDLKLFFYSLLDQMKITPQLAETKEAYLRKLCRHHLVLTDEADILQQEAAEHVKTNEKQLRDKMDDVIKIKMTMTMMIKDCQEFVEKKGSDANKQMQFDWKSSEYKQEVLQAKVEKQMVDLEMLRKKYVDEEKELRTKRYKTEQHLISFLEQYDKDMQNKQNELDAQMEIVMEEKEQYDQLNDQFKEQEIIYNLIMEEKAEYEKRLYEAKLYELKCSISARKIQRYYKNFKKLLRIAGKKDLLRTKRKRKT